MDNVQEYSILKNNLRHLRIIPRITQWDLALRSGVKQSRISLIENFLVKPTMREKIKLAEALSQPIETIFPNNTENNGTKKD